jgi:methyl-accepting chemotaxis protein
MAALLERFGIRTKILMLLSLLGLVAIFVGFQGYRGLTTVEGTYSPIVMKENPATVNLVRANRQVVEMAYAGYRAVAYAGAPREAQQAKADATTAYDAAIRNLRTARQLDPSTAEKVAELEARVTEIQSLVEPAIAAGIRNDSATATALLKRADALIVDTSKEMGAYNNARVDNAKKRGEQAAESSSSTITSLLTVSAIGIIAGMGMGLFVSQAGIIGPLGSLKETMERLSGGSTSVDVPGTKRGDEVGEMARTVLVFKENAVAKAAADVERAKSEAEQKMLVDTLSAKLGQLADGKLNIRMTEQVAPQYDVVKTNFNSAIDALATLVGSVVESAATIQTGADEIARASEDLAQRTEGNAANLEETAAAIAEMEVRVKATADAALESARGAKAAMLAVTEGRSRTDEAVQAMGKVSESAKGIDNVIEGLDKIAFQTRVLAMNAAVEAGRAGEAGRGFAVVADLVSALAMRAEEEAKNARDQLTITQGEISAAVQAVERVDNSLADIASTGQQSETLSGQMATDNAAQATAITQIAASVSSMDAATQQNAAMVEETSAAARTLKMEISGLVDQAARFDLGDSPRRADPSTFVAATARQPSYGSQIRKRPDRAATAAPRVATVPALSSGSEAGWKDF